MIVIYGSYNDCNCYVDRVCMVCLYGLLLLDCFKLVGKAYVDGCKNIKGTWIALHCIHLWSQPLIPCESKWLSSHDPCV